MYGVVWGWVLLGNNRRRFCFGKKEKIARAFFCWQNSRSNIRHFCGVQKEDMEYFDLNLIKVMIIIIIIKVMLIILLCLF